jgi:uncharacterized protein YciI
MQFVVIGLDATDEGATSRRLAARPAHLELGDKMLAAGNLWYGAALLDDGGKMKGSMYLVDFSSEEELQAWLATEPYVTGDVWQSIEIHKSSVRNPWQFSRPKEFFDK